MSDGDNITPPPHLHLWQFLWAARTAPNHGDSILIAPVAPVYPPSP